MDHDLKTTANKRRQLLEAMRVAWPFLLPVLIERRDEKTQALINAENPETRGHIKALQGLIDLPNEVKTELDGLEQAIDDLPD